MQAQQPNANDAKKVVLFVFSRLSVLTPLIPLSHSFFQARTINPVCERGKENERGLRPLSLRTPLVAGRRDIISLSENGYNDWERATRKQQDGTGRPG
jgi:hypothetical protein